MKFEILLDNAIDVLRRRGRISYRALKLELELGDDEFAAICEELVDVHGLADAIENRILVWKGAAPPPPPPAHQEAERRLLTVLFCDVIESTRLSGRLDPEDLREVIGAYQAACVEVIERMQGHVAQYLGDGLLVYFGYPAAHEDDALRAVRAGQEIIQAMAVLNQRLVRTHQLELAVRIGVHCGRVVVGSVGGGGRREVLALGEAPNVAARIQGLAPANGVAISDELYKAVAGFVEVEDLGPQELKGFPQTRHVYAVTAVAEGLGRIEATRGLCPLVSREVEKSRIQEGWRQAHAGRRVGMVVIGEPGVGKSRMVHYARDLAAGQPIFEGRCSELHRNSAFYPLSGALVRLCGAPVSLERLECFLGGLELPGALHVPLLADLLALSVPADRFPMPLMSPPRRRLLTLESLVAVVKALAARQPTLLIVEDLHWVDPSTLDFLRLVFEQTAASRLFVLLSTRPGPLPWGEMPLDELPVRHLDRAGVEQIARHVTGSADLPNGLLDYLAARTDGVPLFVEELTKTLLENGVLERSDQGRFIFKRDQAAGAVPDTVYGCLMARIDRMGAARGVVEIGSVLGRQFSYRLLEEVSGLEPGRLQDHLQQLVESELLLADGQPPEATFTFRHALVHDAAQQCLVKEKRRKVSRKVANALVHRFPETVQWRPEVLAHHYTEAEMFSEAIPEWQRAGLLAIQRSANLEAITHLSKALELVKNLPDGPSRDESELALQTLRAIPLTLTRGWAAPEVRSSFERAQELCGRTGSTPKMFPMRIGLTTYYLVRSEFFRAQELANENACIAQKCAQDGLILEAEQDLCAIACYTGRFEAATGHGARVRQQYDPDKHQAHVYLYGRNALVVTAVHEAIAQWMLGSPDRSLAIATENVRRAESIAHPFSSVWAEIALVLICLLRGEFDVTLEMTDQLILKSEQEGFPNWLAQAMVYHGYALTRRGQLQDGTSEMRQGLEMWEKTGARLLRPLFNTLLAEVLGMTGQSEEALARLGQALEQIRQGGETWAEAEVHRVKGELLFQSDPANAFQAEDCFQRAWQIAGQQNAHSLALRAALSMARLARATHRGAEPQARLETVYCRFNEGLGTRDLTAAASLLRDCL